ncbi:MAG: hypothetical protein WEB09_00035 [Nitriliruptor sp.]
MRRPRCGTGRSPSAHRTTFDAQRVLATVDAEERVRVLDGLLRELEETLGLELRAGG